MIASTMITTRYTNRGRKKKYTEKIAYATSERILNLADYKPNPRLQYNEGEFRGTIDNGKRRGWGLQFVTIPESRLKGLTDNIEDMYARYDAHFDANADERLISEGATIIRSEIRLTDSEGRIQTFVRRDTHKNEAVYY